MEILTLSEAKPRMGRLLDQALNGEAVIIRRGKRLVQLREFVLSEPVPERPVGYFRRHSADYATPNQASANQPPAR